MTRAVEPGRDTPARIIRFHQVQARTGLSRSTIYRRLAGGSFPKPAIAGRTCGRLDRVGGGTSGSASGSWRAAARSGVSDAFNGD